MKMKCTHKKNLQSTRLDSTRLDSLRLTQLVVIAEYRQWQYHYYSIYSLWYFSQLTHS